MPEKISILKESGETLSSNIVSVFMIPDTEKKYIITTENAVDPHGLTVLHVSEIVDDSLQKIATDEEWSSIKTIMRAIISGSVGSFQYLPAFESIKASSQYSRDISVSASAAKQMVDNYTNGEKTAVGAAPALAGAMPDAGLMNQVQMNQASMMPPNNGAVAPNSIFPTNGTATNEDYELAPGIAEMPNEELAANPNQPVMAETPGVPTPVITTNPVTPPPVVPVMSDPNLSGVAPVDNVNAVNQSVVDSMNAMMVGANPNMVAQAMPSAPVAPPVVVPAMTDVQVAQPTQVVPTGQIVQDAQPGAADEVKLDPNAEVNFAPDASLDELVAGSREMFMEGVKNLVKTIQEKVYRDLYNKEAELKQKEAMLEQKEKMLNEQMMSMMNNMVAGQAPQVVPQATQVMQPQPQVVQPQVVQPQVVQPQVVQPQPQVVQQPAVAQPVVMQPTMVQAANDVIT